MPDISAFNKIDILDIFHLHLHILVCLNREEHILCRDKLFYSSRVCPNFKMFNWSSKRQCVTLWIAHPY